MNTKSHRRRATAALCAGILVLAACGDDDDEAADTTAGGEAPATSGGAETMAPTTMAGTMAPTSMAGTMAPTSMAGTMAPTTGPGTSAPTTESGSTPPAGSMELAEGEVFVTGSSTVEPISIRVGELANEMSGGALQVAVEGPGTGDGFEAFCGGGADIADASRQIEEEEIALCEENGVEYIELEIAIDGLTMLTNPANEAITCLDIPALYALTGPESEGLSNWSDATDLATELESAYADVLPDAPLDISAPGEESGTYDTYLEFAIADLAEERGTDEVMRADYSSSGNDNLIVDGIEASESSLGFVGFAYFTAEGDALKAIEVDGGEGCVAPTEETISSGEYPFSRSLYIYVSAAAAEDNPAVASYVDLYLSEAGLATVSETGYVDLPDDRIQATIDTWTGR